MTQRLTVVVLLAILLALPAHAAADVGLHPTTKQVPGGGVIAGHGDGSGMSAYLVPATAGPRRHRCERHAICEPQVSSAPRAPFVLLGRLRRTTDIHATQSFAFRVPAGLEPGTYRLYLYCRPCGGQPDPKRSTRERRDHPRDRTAPARTVRLGPGRAHRQFLVSERAGVILLLRLTVPHGARVVAAGSIPGVAGVRISTRSAACRRAGRVDVCTQPEEWCPMPAAAWHVRLDKISGPAGDIRLDFVVGSPQR